MLFIDNIIIFKKNSVGEFVMSLEIHMAKVGIGDCILVKMGEKSRKLNLLIDSGKNDDGYSETIKYIRNKKEEIDYMVITHDDDDHIMGVFENIVNGSKSKDNTIYSLLYDKHIIVNYWEKGTETLFDYKKIAKIGEKLKGKNIDLTDIDYVVADPLIKIDGEEKVGFSLIQLLWKCDDEGTLSTKVRKYTGFEEECQKNVFLEVESGWEHAEMIILSPTKKSLYNYIKFVWEKYKKDQDETETTFSVKNEKDRKNTNEWDYSIQKLYDNPMLFKEDDSLANNASISFLLCYNGTIGLFAGDSKPSDMINTVQRYLDRFYSGEKKMQLDFMKVPHHASSNNNPLEFIKKFPTSNYLISTKGHNGYKHPGKQTLANIAKAHDEDGKAYIYCNYATWKNSNIRFRDKEINWNVENDLCKIKKSDGKSIELSFCELKKNRKVVLNSLNKEVFISL